MPPTHLPRFARLAATLLVALSLGCVSSLEKEHALKRFFLVDVSHPDSELQVRPASGAPILSVSKAQVSPAFANRSLVYRRFDESFEADFYNEFFVSPGAMLGGEVREWLAHSSLFGQVVDTSSLAAADLSLEISVPQLFGDFASNGPAQAVLELQFLMLDRANDNRVVFQADYSARKPSGEGTPDELVEGLRRGLGEILSQFEGDLRTQGWN